MKTIYILLTRSNSVLSRLIHIATDENYTHVSISFEKSLQPLYSSSRKNGRTIFPAGPCIEEFHRGYYKRNLFIPCALYELQVSDEVYFMAKQEVEQIINHSANYRYNIIGLLLCQMNIPFHRERHFFCSQFVGEVLYRSHALRMKKDTSLIHPCDYMKAPELVCQFQGRLNDLLQERAYLIVT